MIEWTREQYTHVGEIRNLTRRAIHALAALLSPQHAEAFRTAAIEDFYPQIGRGGSYYRLERLLDYDAVTEAERVRIIAMLDEFTADIEGETAAARERYDSFFEAATIRAFAEESVTAALNRRVPEMIDPRSAWDQTFTGLQAGLDQRREEIHELTAAISSRQGGGKLSRDDIERQLTLRQPFLEPSIRPETMSDILKTLDLPAETATQLKELYDSSLHDIVFTWQQMNLAAAAARNIDFQNATAEEKEVVYRRLGDLDSRWIADRHQLEADFIHQASQLLEPPQAAIFTQLVSDAQRDRQVRFIHERVGAQETVDLTSLLAQVDALSSAEREQLITWRSRYVESLHEILNSAEAAYPDADFAIRYASLSNGGNFLSDESLRAYAKMRSLVDPVRQLNDQAIDELAQQISAEAFAAFERVRQRTLYPGVYAESPVERSFALIDDAGIVLDSSIRARLQECHLEYALAEADLRQQLVAAIDRMRTPAAQLRLQQEMRRLQEEGKDPQDASRKLPALPLFARQTALVQRTARRIADELAGIGPEVVPATTRLRLEALLHPISGR
ncbi:MAG: hypothetical protein ACR2GY_11040 [Phycisphaerales bacterium]